MALAFPFAVRGEQGMTRLLPRVPPADLDMHGVVLLVWKHVMWRTNREPCPSPSRAAASVQCWGDWAMAIHRSGIFSSAAPMRWSRGRKRCKFLRPPSALQQWRCSFSARL